MEAGPHMVEACYPGNDTYLGNVISKKMLVFIPTEVLLNRSRFHWSEVNITGSVYDNLGNDVHGFVNIYFNGSLLQENHPTGINGYRMVHSYPMVGFYNVSVVFQSRNYYRGSELNDVITLFSYLYVDYNVTSPIVDIIPSEFGLDNPVMAGKPFNLSLTINSDLGVVNDEHITPQLTASFRGNDLIDGPIYITNLSLNNTFLVSNDMLPEDNFSVVIEVVNGTEEFTLVPNPFIIPINIVQPTYITVVDEQADGILYLNGSVKFTFGLQERSVKSGSIKITSNSDSWEESLISGSFAVALNMTHEWGNRYFTFTYPINPYYFNSSHNLSVQILSITKIKIDGPKNMRYGAKSEAIVTLTRINGDPVPGALITVRMGNENLQMFTDKDGRISFQVRKNENEREYINATYIGDDYHYSSYASCGIDLEGDTEPFSILDLITLKFLILYFILGAMGIFVLRRKQMNNFLHYVKQSAQRLDLSNNPRSVIIAVYNIMSRQIRKFNIIRKDYETVAEFRNEVQRCLRLPNDGIGTLTNLFEFVDYGNMQAREDQKDLAVTGLQNVERELSDLKNKGSPKSGKNYSNGMDSKLDSSKRRWGS